MKMTLTQKSARKAFTLIEMIGVLAVIAILASLLIPKIYEAINNSRISNTVLSYNTVKTALADHYAKYGSLLITNGVIASAPVQDFDKILVSEGFLDKPFRVKLGDAQIQIVTAASSGTAVDGIAASYDLDGSGSTINDISGTLVEAVVTNVAAADAIALSTLLDGASMSQAPNSTTADLAGRVHYPAISGGTTTVRIYVTHR